MSRVIKFRVPHCRRDTGAFDHFSYWGRGINRSEFASPSCTNYTDPGDDEQFTGLLDKNGVEIYEGDILATSNSDLAYDIWSKEDSSYTVVQWSDSLSGFRGSTWDWDVGNEDESIYSLHDFVEVIGNVHQNKDLLK